MKGGRKTLYIQGHMPENPTEQLQVLGYMDVGASTHFACIVGAIVESEVHVCACVARDHYIGVAVLE